jgi:hypothetical protein
MRPDIVQLCSQPQVNIGTVVAGRQVHLDFGLQTGIQFFVQICA